jgi:hypothetical protein
MRSDVQIRTICLELRSCPKPSDVGSRAIPSPAARPHPRSLPDNADQNPCGMAAGNENNVERAFAKPRRHLAPFENNVSNIDMLSRNMISFVENEALIGQIFKFLDARSFF